VVPSYRTPFTGTSHTGLSAWFHTWNKKVYPFLWQLVPLVQQCCFHFLDGSRRVVAIRNCPPQTVPYMLYRVEVWRSVRCVCLDSLFLLLTWLFKCCPRHFSNFLCALPDSTSRKTIIVGCEIFVVHIDIVGLRNRFMQMRILAI